MKRILCYWMMVLVFVMLPLGAINAEEVENVHMVVKLDEGVELRDFLNKNNLSDDEVKVGRNGYVLIQTNDAMIMDAEMYGVQSVESDEKAFIMTTIPNDKYYDTNQWNMTNIGMEGLWDEYKGDDGVVVAVLDTGFNYNHEDLKDIVWVNKDEIANNGLDDDANGYEDDYHGYNFVKQSSNIKDDNDHGSGVASVIVSNSNNKIGLAGVCWDLTIMPVKVASSSGSASLFDIADGIYYAVDNGADIIHMSLGSTTNRDYVEEAVEYAYDHGVLMVAASGNSTSFTSAVRQLYYPAAYDEVMAVGAVDKYDVIATRANSSFVSHHGKDLDLVAPGVDVLAVAGKSDNEYNYYDGTSFAAPHVTGAAALMLSKNHSLTPDQLREYINQSADTTVDMTGDFDTIYGNGRLNVQKAMEMFDAEDDPDEDDPDEDDPDEDINEYGDIYRASWLGQSNYWNMKPGEVRKVWIEFKNTGDSLWSFEGNNALHLSTSGPNDRYSLFYDSSSWLSPNRIEMTNKKSVKPGEEARFDFEIKAPNNIGLYKEYFGLVAENITWLNDMGVFWEFNVTNDQIYSAAWNDQSEFIDVARSEKGESWIEYVNNGTSVWNRDGKNAVHLGTSEPLDRESKLYDVDTWLSKNRIELDQTVVAPGEVGRFSFQVMAPNKKGFFKEYFRPVVENIMWMQDWGVFLQYNVT